MASVNPLNEFLVAHKKAFLEDLAKGASLSTWEICVGNEAGGMCQESLVLHESPADPMLPQIWTRWSAPLDSLTSRPSCRLTRLDMFPCF